MNNTQAAAHIRHRVKVAGIKARVRVAPGGGSVQVLATSPEAVFDDAEQREIRLIAKVNGFTWVRGLEIDIDQMTNPHSFNFYRA
jgi:hypothetical protein